MEQLYKQAVVQGKIHWIGYKIDGERKKVKNVILAFDLSDEIFVELQLPDRMVIGPPIEINITKFGESLAIYHFNGYPWNRTCSIWVMKEYGVVESWNKEFDVPLDPKTGMILGFRNKDEILLTRTTGQLEIEIKQLFGSLVDVATTTLNDAFINPNDTADLAERR
ncbi:hypothetical protein HAX54_018190 [Datura stramonium]|uniref:F-box associated beta-propeller type 1 domain-containing protein n=1 Tax=Datura stramonium TaxID=4076 RepID=A0ABS8UP30_DATST|nr:hypothetical protein [Datura stramonium]